MSSRQSHRRCSLNVRHHSPCRRPCFAQGLPRQVQFHHSRKSCHSHRCCHYRTRMLAHKFHHHTKQTNKTSQYRRSSHHSIIHTRKHRIQSLPKFHTQVLHLLLCLLQLCLCRMVCLRSFVRTRCALLKSSCSLSLCHLHIAQLSCKRRERLCHTSTAQSHLCEHWRQSVHASCTIQCLQKLQQCTIRIHRKFLGERLHFKPCSLCHLCRILKQCRQHILQCRSAFLHRHLVLVHHRGKTHQLCLRHSCLITHTCQAVRKFHNVPLTRARTLCQLVNHTCSRQHSLLQSHRLVSTKHLRQLTNVLHSILAQVLAKSHIYLVCCFHKVKHSLLTLNAQASSIRSKIIQLLTRCTSIQSLKTFIQRIHISLSKSRILCHTRLVLSHLSILIHELLHKLLSSTQFIQGTINHNG